MEHQKVDKLFEQEEVLTEILYNEAVVGEASHELFHSKSKLIRKQSQIPVAFPPFSVSCLSAPGRGRFVFYGFLYAGQPRRTRTRKKSY